MQIIPQHRGRSSGPGGKGAFIASEVGQTGPQPFGQVGPDRLQLAEGQRRTTALTVSAEEFIRRFLQHVLPRGFQKVRHFGFAHPRQQIDRDWLKMLVTVTLNLVYVLEVTPPPTPGPPGPACPKCGAELTFVGFLSAREAGRTAADTS